MHASLKFSSARGSLEPYETTKRFNAFNTHCRSLINRLFLPASSNTKQISINFKLHTVLWSHSLKCCLEIKYCIYNKVLDCDCYSTQLLSFLRNFLEHNHVGIQLQLSKFNFLKFDSCSLTPMLRIRHSGEI